MDILDNTTNQQCLIDIYRAEEQTTQNSEHNFFQAPWMGMATIKKQ